MNKKQNISTEGTQVDNNPKNQVLWKKNRQTHQKTNNSYHLNQGFTNKNRNKKHGTQAQTTYT